MTGPVGAEGGGGGILFRLRAAAGETREGMANHPTALWGAQGHLRTICKTKDDGGAPSKA